MARLADLLEDYRNLIGRANWSIGRDIDAMSGYDPDLAEFVERSSLGTGSHGLGAGGLAGMIKASHGSPHAFTKFDLSKIGTGEGAQAYGHGGYFAQGFDSPVAQQYRDALSSGELRVKGGGEYNPSNPAHMAAAELMNYGGDAAKAINDIQKSIKELGSIKADWRDKTIQEKKVLIDLIKKGGLPELEDVSHGHLYNVELKWPDAAREAADPLGEHHLLDWDAPLSRQSDAVKSALEKFGYKWDAAQEAKHNDALFEALSGTGPVDAIPRAQVNPTGEDIYSYLPIADKTKVSVAEALRKAGIPGIRYLDQASRGAGTGTRNYVIFDQDIPNIVTRNGMSLSDLLKSSETPQNKLDSIIKNLESQGLNVDAFYNPKSNQISLSRLVVPKESRGQGIGTKAMQDLVDFADEQNALMQLSPSTDFGATSINRLKDFYKRFGFVPNTGKYKDFSISESMYRPKK